MCKRFPKVGMTRFLHCFFVVVLLSTGIQAQDDTTEYKALPGGKPAPSRKFDWSRVYVGGNLGLLFGSVTFIDISPLIGYRFTERITAGIGGTYQYIQYNSLEGAGSSIYGGRVFGRYIFTDFLFGHAEYEWLNMKVYVINSAGKIVDSFRDDIGFFWVGGGYQQRLAARAYLTIMALWNIADVPAYVSYPNPQIRIGITAGL